MSFLQGFAKREGKGRIGLNGPELLKLLVLGKPWHAVGIPLRADTCRRAAALNACCFRKMHGALSILLHTQSLGKEFGQSIRDIAMLALQCQAELLFSGDLIDRETEESLVERHAF